MLIITPQAQGAESGGSTTIVGLNLNTWSGALLTTRRTFMAAVALIAAVPMIFIPSLSGAEEDKVQLMFVQTAEDLKADDKTLRLVNVGQQTLYFSDRPVGIAENITMPAYLDEWKAGAGANDFESAPPNATISVYEPGNKEIMLTVVEISHPVIDWIGAGGGVGRGFHGVGVGGRGVGLR